ncbi:tol-pal system YbgF family protein [Pectinatus frisingensis]|uniref:hypothetical protein n=1 Tax=Pectinatus frisingensis TaxID=865 RepID=UPI0018C80B54|nr:hypothetical protein [Pectinatus frisingensis]
MPELNKNILLNCYLIGEKEYIKKNYNVAEKKFRFILENYSRTLNEVIPNDKLYNIYTYIGNIAYIKGNKRDAVKYYKILLQNKPYDKDILIKFYKLLNPLDEVAKIEILNDIYGSTINKLEFLVYVFCEVLFTKIGLYYRQVLQKKCKLQLEKNMEKDFIVTKNYGMAAELAIEELADDYEFITAILMGNSNCDYINIEKSLLDKYRTFLMDNTYINDKNIDGKDIGLILNNFRNWKK